MSEIETVMPHCPKCGSDHVLPGAPGYNRCNDCGHLAVVRDFHRPERVKKHIVTPRTNYWWLKDD